MTNPNWSDWWDNDWFSISSLSPLLLQWTAMASMTTMVPAHLTARMRSWSSLRSPCLVRRVFALRTQTSASSQFDSWALADVRSSTACQTRKSAAQSPQTVKVGLQIQCTIHLHKNRFSLWSTCCFFSTLFLICFYFNKCSTFTWHQINLTFCLWLLLLILKFGISLFQVLN